MHRRSRGHRKQGLHHRLFCHSLKWVSLSTLSSGIKVLTKLSRIVFALQQLEEELESPDMGLMTICTDSRPCTQVTEDPRRHRINLTHVDRDAIMKVCECAYVRRGRACDGTADIHRPKLGRHIHEPPGGGQILQTLEADVWVRAMDGRCLPDEAMVTAGATRIEFTHWQVDTVL
jgi:hypothetical protein